MFYAILKNYENILSLHQKNISIGWKLNGMEVSPAVKVNHNATGGIPNNGINDQTLSRSMSGRPGNISNRDEMNIMMREQELWTKYTIAFATALKGF